MIQIPGTGAVRRTRELDARDRDSGKEVLIRLVEYAGRVHTARLLDSVR